MLLSLSFIFLCGFILSGICQLLKLPRIIGLLFTGIVLGPYFLNCIDYSILSISSELKQIALIIILIKAGLSLNIRDLKKVGHTAILMAFVPATFEIIGYIILAPIFLQLSFIQSALLGCVLAAVSPAVVIPKMISMIEQGYGVKQRIPQLIMAGASCDDIFVLVLFSNLLLMNQGQKMNIHTLVNIPISIITGIILGIVLGYGISYLFERLYYFNFKVRNSTKTLIILMIAFILISIETVLKPYIALSGLIAVMSMACIINVKVPKVVSLRLSEKYSKLWIGAEVILFVLVGASVNIKYVVNTGLISIVLIILTLVLRSVGVLVCLIKTDLTVKEKLFCVIAYLPKATVQAAIGSVPLMMNLPCGEVVLSIAVVAIIITAPLGAILMDKTYKAFLSL